MTTKTNILLWGLAAAVIALTISLVVSLYDGHDNDHMNASVYRGNDSYMGMMQAMGSMDSDQMLSMMRSILGEDDYSEMLQHMADHRNGMDSVYEDSTSGMMHRLMVGMMQRMPDDRGHNMPMGH